MCLNATMVWTDPERAAFVGRVAQAAGLKIVAAGGPGRSGGSSAQTLGVESVEDLRTALAEGPGDIVLIADAGAFGTTDSSGDGEAVLAAVARGARVVSLDPTPASVFELSSGGWLKNRHGRRAIDGVRFIPGASDHSVFASMGEVLASFGAVRVASIRAFGRREHAGLGAAMFSGLSMLWRALGPIEVIDAALVAREQGERSASSTDRLRDLHGHATAMARTNNGAIGRLLASDAADAWERSVELIGPAGRLVIQETGFRWIDPDGALVDSSERSIDADAGAASLASALIRHLKQPEPKGEEFVEVLNVAQAALLSSRTRHPESPTAIARATLR